MKWLILIALFSTQVQAQQLAEPPPIPADLFRTVFAQGTGVNANAACARARIVAVGIATGQRTFRLSQSRITAQAIVRRYAESHNEWRCELWATVEGVKL